jgi:ankyrin repeat protein
MSSSSSSTSLPSLSENTQVKLERAFWNAIENGAVEDLKNCVKQGIPINPPSTRRLGMKALVLACAHGKVDIVRCLTKEYNVIPEIQDQAGWDYAYRRSYIPAIYAEYVVDERFSNLYRLEIWGKNALHVASQFGHSDIVDYFINVCNVDINIQNAIDQWTALHYAVYHHHSNVVQYLVNNGNLNINLQSQLGTALHFATDVKIAQYLVDEGKIDINIQDRDGCTALHRALRGGKIDMIKYLIHQTNVDVDIQDNRAYTVLHDAIQSDCLGRTSLRLEIVQDLIVRHDANMDLQGEFGYTALHLAIQFDHLDIVSWLIAQGVDITITTNAGKNVFDLALQSYYHNDFVLIFLDKLLYTN